MNTNAKHTPGPWTAGSYPSCHRSGRVNTVKADDTLIAEMSVGNKQSGDNARLIAASPEMYRALKVIALTPHIREYLNVRDPKSLEQVLAAIAKAEGKAK